MPALFTRTSIGPASSSIRSKRVATCVGSEESAVRNFSPAATVRRASLSGASQRHRGPDPGEGVGEGLADAS